MQPSGRPPQQYADYRIAKSCKIADIYDESTLNETSIEEVDASIQHSFCNYWATYP